MVFTVVPCLIWNRLEISQTNKIPNASICVFCII